MAETKTCPKCGAELPGYAPEGICPTCLMQAGLGSEQDAGSGPEMNPTTLSSGFVPPEPEDLAKHFPQLEILELLGKGGMGAVYKARQPGLDRLVAVKILPPEVGADAAFAERFTREARALAQLSHQNIVSVFDSGEADGQYYFIMEYVDGANLRHVIETGAIKPEEALTIVPQICEALQFAHDAGIVHRDIKPENILVDKQGRVKIADFGLAKLLGKAPAEITLTGTHQAMGTLHYMAPEQMQGAGSVDHRADIYSLGVVFYEMLTGQLPIGKFEPPSKKVQIDVRLDQVVLRALENEPDRRYQQASDVKTKVVAITSDNVPPTAPAKVSDSVLIPRLTIINLIGCCLWAAVLIALQWGYIADANWYFKKELPYTYLNGLLVMGSVWLVVWLVWWWYVLAKPRETVRSFADFWRLTQTPDPRVRGMWKPGLAYIALWIVAVAISWPYGDTAQAICHGGGFILAPFALMGILRWTYSDRFRQAIDEATSTGNAERSSIPPQSPVLSGAGKSSVNGPADALIVVGCLAFVTGIGIALWLWLVPNASLLQQQTKSTLQMMAVTQAIYAVLILVAGLLMRRLRARTLVLLLVTIVGIAVPAMFVVNVIMEWGKVPQWPVMIPMWLGVPVAIWASILLFRRDVRDAFGTIQRPLS